jgi:AAA domain, putative AbiEii toxin, Type IV TA system/AAA domain
MDQVTSLESQSGADVEVMPRVWISALTFSDGTQVPVSAHDVVLIVGPNNAGKSAALRAIRDKLQNAAHASPVVSSVQIQRSGSAKEFIDWLVGWTVRQVESSPENPVYLALGHGLHQSQAQSEWSRADNVLGGLARWFCHLLSADERLQICQPPGNIALARDNPSHPIHFLLRDDKLELRLSAKFKKAFGVDLVVHRNAGSQVPIHIGERPNPGKDEDRVSISYIERIEKLPTLHTQGDGMRSFAGVLLSTSVGRENILLIDEPEAFLHPPQARLLGATLVQERTGDRQLFIATHSTDIVRGVLNSERPEVKVLRIRRDGGKNVVRLLSNERIKELWGDPLLRYSNILDGLFHESVVVCESDGDCRFYGAVLDAIVATKGDDFKRPDVMFTHCGGKARLAMVIRALREVDVPVKAVADFDVLSSQDPLKSIVEALGLTWSSLEADWQIVKNAIDCKKPDLATAEVQAEISKILAAVTDIVLPKKAKSDIQGVLKRSSAWAHAKQMGKTFVPHGEPTRACERLLAALRAGGLFVAEVGELEGYVRSESGHGPKWVNAVLARQLATDPDLEAARCFVTGLIP